MTDNIVSKVARLHQEERQSQKTHKPYHVLVIEFKDGYVFETFLNNDQKMLIKHAGDFKPEYPGATDQDLA